MKKIICLLFIACIFSSCAFAYDDLELDVYNINLYSDMTGATQLTGTPIQSEMKNGATAFVYIVNNVNVGLCYKDDTLTTVYCTADEDSIGEFLSQAASAIYIFKGSDDIWELYANLIDQYFNARAEAEYDPYLGSDFAFQITKGENNKYNFMILKQ